MIKQQPVWISIRPSLHPRPPKNDRLLNCSPNRTLITLQRRSAPSRTPDLDPYHAQRLVCVRNAWHLGRNSLARPTDIFQKIRRHESELRGIRQQGRRAPPLHRRQITLTICLPMFLPCSRPMKACGAFSNPSATSSTTLISPLATLGPISDRKAGNWFQWFEMIKP